MKKQPPAGPKAGIKKPDLRITPPFLQFQTVKKSVRISLPQQRYSQSHHETSNKDRTYKLGDDNNNNKEIGIRQMQGFNVSKHDYYFNKQNANVCQPYYKNYDQLVEQCHGYSTILDKNKISLSELLEFRRKIQQQRSKHQKQSNSRNKNKGMNQPNKINLQKMSSEFTEIQQHRQKHKQSVKAHKNTNKNKKGQSLSRKQKQQKIQFIKKYKRNNSVQGETKNRNSNEIGSKAIFNGVNFYSRDLGTGTSIKLNQIKIDQILYPKTENIRQIYSVHDKRQKNNRSYNHAYNNNNNSNNNNNNNNNNIVGSNDNAPIDEKGMSRKHRRQISQGFVLNQHSFSTRENKNKNSKEIYKNSRNIGEKETFKIRDSQLFNYGLINNNSLDSLDYYRMQTDQKQQLQQSQHIAQPFLTSFSNAAQNTKQIAQQKHKQKQKNSQVLQQLYSSSDASPEYSKNMAYNTDKQGGSIDSDDEQLLTMISQDTQHMRSHSSHYNHHQYGQKSKQNKQPEKIQQKHEYNRNYLPQLPIIDKKDLQIQQIRSYELNEIENVQQNPKQVTKIQNNNNIKHKNQTNQIKNAQERDQSKDKINLLLTIDEILTQISTMNKQESLNINALKIPANYKKQSKDSLQISNDSEYMITMAQQIQSEQNKDKRNSSSNSININIMDEKADNHSSNGNRNSQQYHKQFVTKWSNQPSLLQLEIILDNCIRSGNVDLNRSRILHNNTKQGYGQKANDSHSNRKIQIEQKWQENQMRRIIKAKKLLQTGFLQAVKLLSSPIGVYGLSYTQGNQNQSKSNNLSTSKQIKFRELQKYSENRLKSKCKSMIQFNLLESYKSYASTSPKQYSNKQKNKNDNKQQQIEKTPIKGIKYRSQLQPEYKRDGKSSQKLSTYKDLKDENLKQANKSQESVIDQLDLKSGQKVFPIQNISISPSHSLSENEQSSQKISNHKINQHEPIINFNDENNRCDQTQIDSLHKFKGLTNDEKDNIVQFLFLDLIIDVIEEIQINFNQNQLVLERIQEKLLKLKVNKKLGFNSGPKQILAFLQQFSKFLQKPVQPKQLKPPSTQPTQTCLKFTIYIRLKQSIGPKPIELLKFMRQTNDEFVELFNRNNDMLSQLQPQVQEKQSFALSLQWFHEFSHLYVNKYDFGVYYPMDEDRQSKRKSFLKNALHIHNKCIFDCINQVIDKYRPYGILGQPFPWKPHVVAPIPNYESFHKILNKTFEQVSEYSRYLCGIFTEQHLNYKLSQREEQELSEDRLNKLLCRDLHDGQPRWMFLGDQQTQACIQIAASLFTMLINQSVNEIVSIIKNES